MAKGYPDFFGYSIFPQFGTFTQEHITVVCPNGGVETELLSITGKGKTYAGYVRFTNVDFDAPENQELRGEIDGVDYLTDDFWAHARYNYSDSQDLLFKMVCFDVRQALVAYLFGKDWTFNSSLKLMMYNNGANNVTAWGYFHWARVT